MRLIYSALWWLALPPALLRLWWRGRAEPGYRQHIAERFGIYGASTPPRRPLETAAVGVSTASATTSSILATRPLIWLHAVSVGETRAAQPLIDGLMARYPDHGLLLTHMTATGRATGAELFAHYGERFTQAWLPYDTGLFAACFLRHFRPAVCILMETEVWPNMIAQCARFAVPVALVNARLSARSLRRGLRLGGLMRRAAAGIGLVAAQTTADADRLLQCGAANVHVTGSIKFDVAPAPALIARGKMWRSLIGDRPVLLCASTREGEEELILAALKKLPGPTETTAAANALLTVIVPRHPQRFDAVAASIGATFGAEALRRRSAWKKAESDGDASTAATMSVTPAAPIAATMTAMPGIGMDHANAGPAPLLPSSVRFVIGDSMGEMFAYYAACDVAFIGGSLLPLGGQNLIEAALLGKPVLIGPHTFNFAQSSDDAVAAGAAQRVTDADAMLAAALRLLGDRDALAAAGEAASAFAQRHQGATARTISLLQSLLQTKAAV